MSLREVYSAIRDLNKKLAVLRSQRGQTLVSATVEEVKGDRVRIRLMDEGADGKPVLSPWLRMAANTGKRGAGVSEFTKYGVGDTVLAVSPNGKLGTMSGVLPWISTGDDPSPGTAEADGKIITIGNSKLEMRDGFAKLSQGAASIEFSGGKITLTGDVQVNGASLKHNSKNVGATHTNAGLPVD
jgi:hypothetical protein